MGKYKKMIILYCGSIGFILVMFIFMNFIISDIPSFYNYFTGNLFFFYFLCLIGWVIVPMIGVLLGYRFAPFLLWIHKKTKGSRVEYFIDKKMELKEFKFTFQNIFFPALMAFNLAMILSSVESIQQLLLTSETLENANTSFIPIYLIPPLVVITGAISTALFSVSSFLLDTGIVFINKEKMEKSLEPIKIYPVGQGYMSILKGYAGLSVIFTIITLIYEMFTAFEGVSFTSIFGVVMWSLNPFLLSFILIPMMILIDKFHNKGRLFLLNYAKKLEITKALEEILILK